MAEGALTEAAATNCMKEAFGKSPYDWQISVISHLLLMTWESPGNAPAPVFFVAPTGGGKSLTRDSFAASQGGVSWCVCPLLALGADQEFKINQHSQNGDGCILAIHLDEYKGDAAQRDLCGRLQRLTARSRSTLIILSSPQAITNRHFHSLFLHFVKNNLLRLFSVDEVQLFVQFGLRFRSEFFAMKLKVFRHLLLGAGGATRCPVLFMTATADQTILQQTELLTGLTFAPPNLLWPPADLLLVRRCNFKVRYEFRSHDYLNIANSYPPHLISCLFNFYRLQVDFTTRAFSKLKGLLDSLLAKSECNSVRLQWRVFANSRAKVESLADQTKLHLDCSTHSWRCH